MQFYKVVFDVVFGEADEKEKNELERKRSARELSRKIMNKTGELNSEGRDGFCFVSSLGEEEAVFGVIATKDEEPTEIARELCGRIGFDAAFADASEITLAGMKGLLGSASRSCFIGDDDEVLERFGLDRLSGHYGRGIEFGENLVDAGVGKEDLIASAKELYADETLTREIDRIYAGSKSPASKGHPVHYIVECNDSDVRRNLCRTILGGLYANGRLKSRRYFFLDFHPGESYSRLAFDALYKISDGGAVIIRYASCDDSGDDSNASAERETIESISEMAKKYRSSVLTVICIGRECNREKTWFYESLGSMAFVEIREDFLQGEAVKGFLGSLARKNHVRADKALYKDVREEQSYLATELVSIFDEWYNNKLKTVVYPQYKEISVLHNTVAKAKPTGSAYDELFDMIGLTEAKAVIKKALNYYKMQQLYIERGVKRTSPAMHMIFTGNPGTAKTTVARLFARIMRENGLLPSGHLVEVGRAELVGRYVGWTAQTVLRKFREAKGGVLFIDEAYSLVDDRDGSFGDEAINTIVQEMENHREDVVVIFAGYPDKMEGFLKKNPGLRSRIAFHVPFADYDSGELCRITELISKKNGMKLDGGALLKLQRIFDSVRGEADFGNGRYARNLFEKAKMNQASRLLEMDFDSISAEEIITITADDVGDGEVKKSEVRRIGFC